MSYRIDGHEQGVPYYVRVAATNAIGYGEALLATPRNEIPLSGTSANSHVRSHSLSFTAIHSPSRFQCTHNALIRRGHETEPIEYNAADSTVKRRLEELPNVGTVTVNRVQTSPEKTYRWTVTFDSNPGLFPAGT